MASLAPWTATLAGDLGCRYFNIREARGRLIAVEVVDEDDANMMAAAPVMLLALQQIAARVNGASYGMGPEIVEIATRALCAASNHKWGTDGQHQNEYCKRCFASRP
jgi:hypothetical protein